MSLEPQPAPERPTYEVFSTKMAPVLADGHWSRYCGMAENLWMRLKVYATGGENGLHAHAKEDHAFFVLSGRATFENGKGETHDVGPFEGVFIPKGALYRFQSSGEVNLVMLRAGGAQYEGSPRGDRDGRPDYRPSTKGGRLGKDGTEAPGDAATNLTGAMPAVIVPGEFFDPS